MWFNFTWTPPCTLLKSQQVDYFAFNKAIVKKKKNQISLGSSKKKKSSYELENKQKVN